jgi:hypothetical protein
METLLLGITVVSLVVAFIMSVAAWRLLQDEKKRSAARVAALSLAAGSDDDTQKVSAINFEARVEKPVVAKAPWAPPPPPPAAELPLNFPRAEAVRVIEPAPAATHATGFLGASDDREDTGGRQRGLMVAAAVLFVVMSGGLFWMMSEPRGTTAVAVGPNAPLELMSLSHARQNEKLAVSGLVRNPVAGAPVERLSAVVFLFDRSGTFVTSSKANVDFLKLGAGDESPFVVSLDAPPTVARYRVSFRTDDGVVPHVDRRVSSPVLAEGEQPVNVTLK